MYRSIVKSIQLRYDGLTNTVEVDLVPNDTMLDKFFRFWTMMGPV